MEKIDFLIIQSTETGEGTPVTKGDIINWHTLPVALGGKGWNRPGTDYLVRTDGTLETIIPENSLNTVDLWGIGKGDPGVDGVCKFIAYEGGKSEKETKDKDTRTSEQIATLEVVIRFYILKFPEVRILGFNEAPTMTEAGSPAFEVSTWLKELGLDPKNIYKTEPVKE